MLFKISYGDSSRISTDITPFQEGHAYVTYNGDFYIDLNIGTAEAPNNQRIKLNAKQAESLVGYTISAALNNSEVEIPTSKAVKAAVDSISVPTKTSELINDSGFITQAPQIQIITWEADD